MPFDATETHANLSIPPAVLAAERAVATFNHQWSLARKKFIAALYDMLGALTEVDATHSLDGLTVLLQSKHVDTTPDDRNRHTLLIKAFCNDDDPDHRFQRCKWAGVIAFARARRVTNRLGFIDFIKNQGGIQKAYTAWTERKSQPREQIKHLKQLSQRAETIVSGAPNKFYDPCDVTRSAAKERTGLHLAALQVAEDGTFKVIKVFPRQHMQVAEML